MPIDPTTTNKITIPNLLEIGRGITDTDQFVGHDGTDMRRISAVRLRAYALQSIPHAPIVANWSADGDVYYVAPATMRIVVMLETGTGTISLAVQTNGAGAFNPVTLPFTLNSNDVLRMSAANVTGYKAATLQ